MSSAPTQTGVDEQIGATRKAQRCEGSSAHEDIALIPAALKEHSMNGPKEQEVMVTVVKSPGSHHAGSGETPLSLRCDLCEHVWVAFDMPHKLGSLIRGLILLLGSHCHKCGAGLGSIKVEIEHGT